MAEIITPRYDYIPQAEAYPPEEWTWRGIIYPGVFEGTTSFIQYKFDTIKRDLATGAAYYTNYGTDGLHYNAPAQGSNHVWLNGTTQTVDLPTVASGYATYFDVDTKVFVTIAITDGNPLTQTTSFSSYFTTDVPVTEGDRSYLTSNPEALYAMWFGEPVVGLSFSKANMINFVPSTEGLQGGAYLQDLSVDLGSNINDINLATRVGGWTIDIPSEISTFDGVSAGLVYYNTAITGVSYLVNFDVTGTLELNQYEEYTNLALSDGSYSMVLTPLNDYISFQGRTAYGVATVKVNSIQEVTAYEIANYTDTCRTTLANTNYGASNFAMVQDGSGRTTGMGVANTQNFPPYDDGRYASTGLKLSIARYSIEETVTGELQDFGSELAIGAVIQYGANTVTDNGDGTYTVDVIDDGRGFYTDIVTTIGETYILNFNTEATTLTTGNYIVVGPLLTFGDITEVGVSTLTFVSTVTSTRIRGGNVSIGGSFTFSMSAKELTTKTQRTEQRLLTHTDNHLGDEQIINGTFDTDTDWTKGIGWSISDGEAHSDGTQTAVSELSPIEENLVVGVAYITTFEITSRSAGAIRFVHGILQTDWISDVGIYSYIFIADGLRAKLKADIDFIGSVDNFSVKEILTQNKYYIDGVEQAVTPPLPDPLVDIDLNNTAVIGYPDPIDSRLANFEIHNEVLIP